MSAYSEASQFKQMLKGIIDEMIENHPLVKKAMKADKALVWEVANTTTKTVKVKLLGDIFSDTEPLTFAYNAQLENYLVNATPKQTAVWVCYTQSLNNGVVLYDGTMTIGG